MSQDLGRAASAEPRAGLLEMYRTAISYLDSLSDPGVQPLREELTALRRSLEDEPQLRAPGIETRP